MQENITVLEYRFDWFPAKFCWKDRIYQIDAVNECKTVSATHAPIYHFWVRCEGRLLHLMHFMQSNRWALCRD